MADGDQQQQQQQNQQQQQQQPWHHGLADPETLGHWQNKLPADVIGDPAKVAIEMTKQAREAAKFIGAPPEQLIRLPKDAKDEAGWKSVHQRLGVPKEATEYDFSAVKRADGNALDPALTDAIRASAFTNNVTKDAAAAVAADVAKALDAVESARSTEQAAKLAEQKANLHKSWGTNKDINLLTAAQGAKRLGVSAEAVVALEKTLGYAEVMEMFRKIGAGTSEDTFVDGKSGNPKTMESAQSRLNELMTDQAWAKRLLAGDVTTKREFDALSQQIAGIAA
jgi:hypothetical protein